MRRIILVTGPPCAGKTTYVAQHAEPGDTVLDQDTIGARAMTEALSRLPRHGTIWIIRCAPGPQARGALAEQIGATERVHLVAPPDALHERARQRPNPGRHHAAIDAWYATEARDPQPHATKSKLSSTARGYGTQHRRARQAALDDLRRHDGQPCPHCALPMWSADAVALDLDHTDDRTGYRGLAHATCNRRAGQAKAIRNRAAQTTNRRSRNW